MKITLKGECTLPELRQAMYEQLTVMQQRFAVRYARGATLYLTPTNGFGDEVRCLDHVGREVPSLFCNGPYRSAADHYDLHM